MILPHSSPAHRAHARAHTVKHGHAAGAWNSTRFSATLPSCGGLSATTVTLFGRILVATPYYSLAGFDLLYLGTPLGIPPCSTRANRHLDCGRAAPRHCISSPSAFVAERMVLSLRRTARGRRRDARRVRCLGRRVRTKLARDNNHASLWHAVAIYHCAYTATPPCFTGALPLGPPTACGAHYRCTHSGDSVHATTISDSNTHYARVRRTPPRRTCWLGCDRRYRHARRRRLHVQHTLPPGPPALPPTDFPPPTMDALTLLDVWTAPVCHSHHPAYRHLVRAICAIFIFRSC